VRRSALLVLSCCLLTVLLIHSTGCNKDDGTGPEPDTTPPPPVTNLTVTQQQLGLYLDWVNDDPVSDLKGYYVRRDPALAGGFVFAQESFYLDRSVTEGAAYVYTVTAVDDSLNESTPVSSEAAVYDTRGPLVSLTSPPNGFVTNQAIITVQGTVIDSQTVTVATIFVNGSSVAQAPVTAGAFSGQVTLANGTNLIKAQATDPSGNIGTSTEIGVTLDTNAVIVQITEPADGIITRETRIQVSGTTSDQTITQATLIVNGEESSVAVVNGQFTGAADLDEGVNVIRVTATNQAGTSGDSGPIDVTRDTQVPQVRIVQPVDGTPFQESPIFISGTVTDSNPPDSVTLSISGEVRKLILADGQFQVWSEIDEGSNQIVVSAVDLAGNAGSASATVYLNSQGPTVRITTPLDGTLVNSRTVDVGGTVTDPAIISGTMFVDGVPQIVSIQSGIFLVSATVGSDGTHRFWVEVVDQYDRPGVSDTVSVIVDTTAPALVITAPADGSMGNSPSISVAGQIDDQQVTSVTVVVNGFSVQTTPHSGSFSTQVTLSEGWNDITARATDIAGNTGVSDTTTALLDTQAEIDEVGHDAVGEVLEVGDHVLFWVDAGEPNGTATVDIGQVHTGIALYDNGSHGDNLAGDGIYKVDYTIQSTDQASQAQVIGHFTDHVGNVALAQSAAATITINAPPTAVTLVQPGWTQVTSQAVYLRWTATTIPDFRDYRLYRKTSAGVDTLSTLVTTITTIGTDSVLYTDRDASLVHGTRYYYKVFVRDLLGAVVGSNEVNAVIDSWPTEQTYIIPSGNNPCYMDRLDGTAQGSLAFLSHLSDWPTGQINVINLGNNTVVTTLPITQSTAGVACNPYGEALVAGYTYGSNTGKIYRVHGQNLDFTEPPFVVGGQPWDVDCAWGREDTLYAFTGVGTDSIVVMNLWSGYVDGRFRTPSISYTHFESSPDFEFCYAASPSGSVARIDPYDWVLAQTVGGLRSIFHMAVTDDYIFLSHHDDGRVTVMTRWTMQVQRELTIGGNPAFCLLLPNEHYLYVCCKTQNVIEVWDTQTWQLIDRISVVLPVGMVSDVDGERLYVSRLPGQGVVVLDY